MTPNLYYIERLLESHRLRDRKKGRRGRRWEEKEGEGKTQKEKEDRGSNQIHLDSSLLIGRMIEDGLLPSVIFPTKAKAIAALFTSVYPVASMVPGTSQILNK